MTIDVRFFKILLRRIINMKLNKLGFFTREFVSEDLKSVFLVMKAQENVIQKHADV